MVRIKLRKKDRGFGENRGECDLSLIDELVLEKGRGFVLGRKGWGKIYLESFLGSKDI